MIYSKPLTNWKDLQEKVGRILSECGFSIEIEKRVKSVRNTIEIDVYGEEVVDGRKSIVICECKYWESPVPQSVVHSFRTVMGDIGANVGYIISKNGFQPGAIEAAERTNVKLKTWEEFQLEYESTWFKAFLVQEVERKLGPLLTYTEPILPKWFHGLPEHEKKEYCDLKDQYDELGAILLTMFSPASTRVLGNRPRPDLPLSSRIQSTDSTVPTEILQAQAFMDFLDSALKHGEQAIGKFRAIKTRNGH